VLLTRSALGRAPALAPSASIAWMTEPGVTGYTSTTDAIAASTLYALALFEAVQFANKVCICTARCRVAPFCIVPVRGGGVFIFADGDFCETWHTNSPRWPTYPKNQAQWLILFSHRAVAEP
jgi:hypothetical protein